jgi:hypothetical protein
MGALATPVRCQRVRSHRTHPSAVDPTPSLLTRCLLLQSRDLLLRSALSSRSCEGSAGPLLLFAGSSPGLSIRAILRYQLVTQPTGCRLAGATTVIHHIHTWPRGWCQNPRKAFCAGSHTALRNVNGSMAMATRLRTNVSWTQSYHKRSLSTSIPKVQLVLACHLAESPLAHSSWRKPEVDELKELKE